MSGGRGQVTVFFLLGLAVLLVLLLILVLRQALLDKPAARGIDKQLIEDHVVSCLDLAAQRSFVALGEQGGRLYATQGGLDPDAAGKVVSGPGTNVRVGYGLRNASGNPFRPCTAQQMILGTPSSCPSFTVSSEYPYPWPNTPLSTLTGPSSPLATWAPDFADGAFGQYALPPTCAASLWDATGRCPTPLYGANATQEGLGRHIAAGVQGCVQLDLLAEQLGATVRTDDPVVNVTFTERETIVALTMPLRLASEDADVSLVDFERRYKVRVLAVERYLFRLLKEESKNLMFNISDSAHYRSIPSYDEFAITARRLTAAEAGDDRHVVVQLLDPSSRVDGGPWAFQFLVEDRAPVLDTIADASYTAPDQAVSVRVRAIDPDSEPLTLAIFDISSGSPVPLSPPPPSLSLVTGGPETGSYAADVPLPAGRYNVSVTDGAGTSDWQVVTVTRAT